MYDYISGYSIYHHLPAVAYWLCAFCVHIVLSYWFLIDQAANSSLTAAPDSAPAFWVRHSHGLSSTDPSPRPEPRPRRCSTGSKSLPNKAGHLPESHHISRPQHPGPTCAQGSELSG